MFDFHHEACANSTKPTCHSSGVLTMVEIRIS